MKYDFNKVFFFLGIFPVIKILASFKAQWWHCVTDFYEIFACIFWNLVGLVIGFAPYYLWVKMKQKPYIPYFK